jgi:hypothetical protein
MILKYIQAPGNKLNQGKRTESCKQISATSQLIRALNDKDDYTKWVVQARIFSKS